MRARTDPPAGPSIIDYGFEDEWGATLQTLTVGGGLHVRIVVEGGQSPLQLSCQMRRTGADWPIVDTSTTVTHAGRREVGLRFERLDLAPGAVEVRIGLYDEEGALQHVGVAASFTAEKRRELVSILAPYREGALADHPWQHQAEASAEQRMPGAKSRWSQGKDLSWEPLRPERVVEVAYDHMQGSRFRHTAHFRRWRPDKSPRDCTYDQLEVVAPHELAAIFAGGR